MTPLFIVFYQLRSIGPAWQLLVVAALGTWALVVNGTFFAAMSLRTRSREIMLPLLLFRSRSRPPSHGAIHHRYTERRRRALLDRVACNYDLVFTTVCLLLFETVLNAE